MGYGQLKSNMTITPETVKSLTMPKMTSLPRRCCETCARYHLAGDAEFVRECEAGTPRAQADGAWTENDRMPFGVHHDKLLKDVPRAYLLWLRDDGCRHRDLMEYLKTL